MTSKPKPRTDVCIFTTIDVRHKLKIIAAITGRSMKQVLEHLIAAEYKAETEPVGRRRGNEARP